MAGGLKNEDTKYFNEIKDVASNDNSILLLPNVPFTRLLDLYKRAMFYWHFSGYGIDEEKNPELVEHLGITPLEAMASGCITFCYKAGGVRELVKDRVNGYLFHTIEELVTKMKYVHTNQLLQQTIKNKAKNSVRQSFSYEVFKKKVKEIIL